MTTTAHSFRKNRTSVSEVILFCLQGSRLLIPEDFFFSHRDLHIFYSHNNHNQSPAINLNGWTQLKNLLLSIFVQQKPLKHFETWGVKRFQNYYTYMLPPLLHRQTKGWKLILCFTVSLHFHH